MINDTDFVRAIRIPRDLYERIRVWSEQQKPSTKIVDAIRYVLERGMKEVERKRKGQDE